MMIKMQRNLIVNYKKYPCFIEKKRARGLDFKRATEKV